MLWHRCHEVVPDTRLVVKELASHDRADRMAATVTLIAVARSIAEEACDRIDATRLEFRSENVQ
jgi:hypothetical protein